MNSSQKSAHRVIIELTGNLSKLFELKEQWTLRNAFLQWKETSKQPVIVNVCNKL